MTQPVLKIQNLTKTFGDFTAVRDLSFHLGQSEVLGLLGANGAGKTTTIHMMLGLTTPTSGSIEVFGKDLEKNRLQILNRVNFSSAYVSMPSNLTVRENLHVFAHLYNVPKPRQKVAQLVERFDLQDQLKKMTGALSSGQITRMNLCKALLNDPEILFLDEPTASLDPEVALHVRALLQREKQERDLSIIYTSHNMQEVERMCDRIIFMSHGSIVAQGTADELKEQADEQTLEEVFISIARKARETGNSEENS